MRNVREVACSVQSSHVLSIIKRCLICGFDRLDVFLSMVYNFKTIIKIFYYLIIFVGGGIVRGGHPFHVYIPPLT